MNILDYAKDATKIIDVTFDIIEDAAQHGFKGFGGYCAQAAVLINECLFDNQQKYYGAFNKALDEKNHWIGHVVCYVEFLDDYYFIFDTDCEMKDFEDIEHWGMLDSQDTDYKKLFQQYHIAHTEENYETIIQKFLQEEDLRKHFSFESYQEQKNILMNSCQKILEKIPTKKRKMKS